MSKGPVHAYAGASRFEHPVEALQKLPNNHNWMLLFLKAQPPPGLFHFCTRLFWGTSFCERGGAHVPNDLAERLL